MLDSLKCMSCFPLLLIVSVMGEDFQVWSERSYLGADHNLTCNDTSGQLYINHDDHLMWSRMGQDGYLDSSNKYELSDSNGIPNMTLVIRQVTDVQAGIYFCHVFNSSGHPVGRVVKGLNLAGPILDDNFSEYKWNVIVGFIAAGSVMALILGVGLVENFRFLTEDQKSKRKERKAKGAKMASRDLNGVDNMGGFKSSQDDLSSGSDHKKHHDDDHMKAHIEMDEMDNHLTALDNVSIGSDHKKHHDHNNMKADFDLIPLDNATGSNHNKELDNEKNHYGYELANTHL